MKFSLRIHIIWHPDFEEGEAVASSLYSKLTKDPLNPSRSQIGIPVYYRSESYRNDRPKPIDFDLADRNVIILLASSHMKLDEEFIKFVEDQYEAGVGCGTPFLLLPVAFRRSALNISDKLSHLNFARYYEYPSEVAEDHLEFRLFHELVRFIYGRKAVSDLNTEENRAEEQKLGKPVKIFISHTKDVNQQGGGEAVAKIFKTVSLSELGLNAFFDVLHIPVGQDFAQSIEESIEDSAVLVIHSDRYSSREWCKREVIMAKQKMLPMVVVNVFKKGEERSFPYMSNVPNFHWIADSYEDIPVLAMRMMLLVMKEVLRFKYQEIYLDALLDGSQKVSEKVIMKLPFSPELLSLLNTERVKDKNIVVYPDPPLGEEETKLLLQMRPGLSFLTPSQLDL